MVCFGCFERVFCGACGDFCKSWFASVDSDVATAVRAIVMTVFIVGFVVAMGKGPQLTQLTSKDMVFIVLSGVAGAISWLLYFAALKMADTSKVTPVDRASLLFVLVLSALLLGEQITPKDCNSNSNFAAKTMQNMIQISSRGSIHGIKNYFELRRLESFYVQLFFNKFNLGYCRVNPFQ